MLFVEIVEPEDNVLFSREELVVILQVIEVNQPEAVQNLLGILQDGDLEDIIMLDVNDALFLLSLIPLEDHPLLTESFIRRVEGC